MRWIGEDGGTLVEKHDSATDTDRAKKLTRGEIIFLAALNWKVKYRLCLDDKFGAKLLFFRFCEYIWEN